MACTLSGKNIVHHAENNFCPENRYDESVIDRSDAIEDVIQKIKARKTSVQGMHNWENVQAAFKKILAEWKSSPYYNHIYPFKDSGIVIAGGGKYFPSAYVTIRLIRQSGCQLPIELWYLGDEELIDWQKKALEPLNVHHRNAVPLAQCLKHPSPKGWAIKSFAVRYSNFRHILFLDADSYPVENPENLFSSQKYRRTGAVFCPDISWYDIKPELWGKFGAQPRDEMSWETGQFMVDKVRHWEAVNRTVYLDSFPDYFHRPHAGGPFGDAFSWHLAWRLTNAEFAYAADERWAWEPPACIQYWKDDNEDYARPMWVHRINGKFAFNGAAFLSKQRAEMHNDTLPREDDAWRAFLDVQKAPGRKLALLELGGLGDLIVLMPAMKYMHQQGFDLTYVSRPQHGEMLEGISWVGWLPLDVGKDDHGPAQKMIQDAGLEQLDKLPHPTKPNWCQSSWARTGLPFDLFHSLPLEIENRRSDAEAQLIQRHVKTRKPLLLVNTSAVTSPFDAGPELVDFLGKTFRGRCEILDLSHVRAEKFRDLLGLYDRAFCLVTVDTATLHLAYANRMPVVALLADWEEWRASTPRAHWTGHMTYGRAKTEEGRTEIARLIETVLPIKGLDIPLAGNVIEAIAKKIGADRLAEWWEEKTGIPCGCIERREKINKAQKVLMRWAKKIAQQ